MSEHEQRTTLPPELFAPLSPEELATLSWARGLLRAGSRAGAPPRFGSREWLRLPEGDRRKVAAVVLAALCWWEEFRPAGLARRLADELDATRLAEERIEAEEFARLAAGVRAMANRPTHAELVRRRAEPREVVMVAGRARSLPRTRADFPGREGR